MPPNLQNLIPLNKRSPEERKRIRSMGAHAANAKKRQKRDLREAIIAVLAADLPTKGGEIVSGAEGVARAWMSKALKGDLKAIQQVLDLLYGRKSEVDLKGNVVTKLPDLNITFLPEKTDDGGESE